MNKAIVGILSRIFPTWMTKMAYRQLTSPQVRKLRERELTVLGEAQQETLIFKDYRIKTYRWGDGPRRLLLIHGWEGQAGNFSDLVRQLPLEDFSVYAFDGPSHGFSSKGETSLFEFAELVGVLIRHWEVDQLVSHSFGGVATTYALYANLDLQIDRYALLTSPDRFTDRIDDVARQVGISEVVKARLVQQLEAEIQMDISTLNVSDFVGKIQVAKALLIHDKADRVIPIQYSRNIHQQWPQCEMIEVEGTGHFRILRSEDVLQKVVQFLHPKHPLPTPGKQAASGGRAPSI